MPKENIPFPPRSSLKPSTAADWRRMPIRSSSRAQASLTGLLSKLYFCQKRYGDTPETIFGRDEIWQKIFADIPFYQIEFAVEKYIQASPDFPAPADILRIIERDFVDISAMTPDEHVAWIKQQVGLE